MDLFTFVQLFGKPTEDPFVWTLPSGTYTVTTEGGIPVVKEFVPLETIN